MCVRPLSIFQGRHPGIFPWKMAEVGGCGRKPDPIWRRCEFHAGCVRAGFGILWKLLRRCDLFGESFDIDFRPRAVVMWVMFVDAPTNIIYSRYTFVGTYYTRFHFQHESHYRPIMTNLCGDGIFLFVVYIAWIAPYTVHRAIV